MPDPLPIERSLSLRHHLEHNHFPSVHPMFVPVAEAAIDIAAEAVEDDLGMLDDELLLPNGVRLPVRQVMDELHLWAYITQADL
jgi:hypothetical protein